ncbi:hypothetical protein BZA05DRAFT_105865 [Tricharina praecox]|uniref:uncharacterized protein n=1 Tax=Tricharina praecox TaxID=43433 RepID=UPI00221E766C|nr:uncharacterized protein BZA05DRAFT_105865 [Tricharina praecox]KAI5857781.1 hypothetical protein BZA05DRAFT_105865 [Tricharina praecox]
MRAQTSVLVYLLYLVSVATLSILFQLNFLPATAQSLIYCDEELTEMPKLARPAHRHWKHQRRFRFRSYSKAKVLYLIDRRGLVGSTRRCQEWKCFRQMRLKTLICNSTVCELKESRMAIHTVFRTFENTDDYSYHASGSEETDMVGYLSSIWH